jgi:hypothetical protein
MLHLGSTLQQNIPTAYCNIDSDIFQAHGHGSEANIRPFDGMTVDLGAAGTYTWTEMTVDASGMWKPDTDQYVAYFHIYLVVPGADTREVRYRFYHDDHLKVFCNGRQIYRQNYDGQEHVCDDYLSPGVNSITIKLQEGGGGDYVRVSMTDRNDQFFTDISYRLAATDLVLKNPITGSAAYTCTNVLNAAVFPVKDDCDRYQVSLSSDPADLDPDGWLAYDPADVPGSIAFPETDPSGLVDIHVWLQSTNSTLYSTSYGIVYSNTPPTMIAEDCAPPCLGDQSATITVADIDKGSLPNLGVFSSLVVSCPEDQTPAADYLTLAPRAQPYIVTLAGMNEAGVSASTNVLVTLIAKYEAFNLDFESEEWANEGTPIATEAFNANGGMKHPTAVHRNGYGWRGSGIDQPRPGLGFTSQHARLFGHNSDCGTLQLEAPNLTPFTGTTANPGNGRLWTFSFDMGYGYPPTDTLYDVIANRVVYPAVILRSAPDASGNVDNLLYFVCAERGYLVGYPDGHVDYIPNALGNQCYRTVVEIDAESGTFRVKGGLADGELAYAPGVYPLNGSMATKGIGGIYIHAQMTAYAFGETQYRYDNIRLAADKVANTIPGFRVTDAVTGDPATATGSALSIAGTAFGPGYTKYILEVGTNPQAPVDGDDARWVSGTFPSSATIPSPANGTEYAVALWLLGEDGAIAEFTQGIAYAASAAPVAGLAVTVSDGVPTATWTTATPTGGRIWHGTTAAATDGVTAYEPAPVTSHSAVIEGLVPGKTYYAVAEAGGARSGSAVSFDYLVDNPVILDVAISTNHIGHLSATWTTDIAAIGWIECAPDGGGETVRSAFGAYGTSHSADVGGLAEHTRYTVTIHADASSVSRRARTRRIGAFAITFDDDPMMRPPQLENGFVPIECAPYDIHGGMTLPTHALRYSLMNRADSCTMAPQGPFATQWAFVRIHHDTGRLQLLPGSGVTEPIAGTDRHVAGDPWVFSVDLAFGGQLFNSHDNDGWCYFNLHSNRGESSDFGVILSIQMPQHSDDLVVLYGDGHGNEQSAMLVEDMVIRGDLGNRTPIYHLEFVLDMASQTFDAYVDGECVATGLGFHSPTGNGIAGFDIGSGGVWGGECWHLDNICLSGGVASQGTLFLLR